MTPLDQARFKKLISATLRHHLPGMGDFAIQGISDDIIKEVLPQILHERSTVTETLITLLRPWAKIAELVPDDAADGDDFLDIPPNHAVEAGYFRRVAAILEHLDNKEHP